MRSDKAEKALKQQMSAQAELNLGLPGRLNL